MKPDTPPVKPGRFDILAYVLDHLERSKGQWPAIAHQAGVSYSTLNKIAQRQHPNPGVLHVQRLFDYFRAQESGKSVPGVPDVRTG